VKGEREVVRQWATPLSEKVGGGKVGFDSRVSLRDC